MKKNTEEPNFATKSSVGRVKTKKDRRINTEGLHIVEDYYKPNMKYGIQSLVDDDLDSFEDDEEYLSLDVLDYEPNPDDEFDNSYGYN